LGLKETLKKVELGRGGPTATNNEDYERLVQSKRVLEETIKRLTTEKEEFSQELRCTQAALSAKDEYIETFKLKHYELIGQLKEKENQISIMNSSLKRNETLMEEFEKNFLLLKEEVENRTRAFEMEQEIVKRVKEKHQQLSESNDILKARLENIESERQKKEKEARELFEKVASLEVQLKEQTKNLHCTQLDLDNQIQIAEAERGRAALYLEEKEALLCAYEKMQHTVSETAKRIVDQDKQINEKQMENERLATALAELRMNCERKATEDMKNEPLENIGNGCKYKEDKNENENGHNHENDNENEHEKANKNGSEYGNANNKGDETKMDVCGGAGAEEGLTRSNNEAGSNEDLKDTSMVISTDN
jgi:chromosome segregation ATPase